MGLRLFLEWHLPVRLFRLQLHRQSFQQHPELIQPVRLSRWMQKSQLLSILFDSIRLLVQLLQIQTFLIPMFLLQMARMQTHWLSDCLPVPELSCLRPRLYLELYQNQKLHRFLLCRHWPLAVMPLALP